MDNKRMTTLAFVGLLAFVVLAYGCTALGFRQDCVRAENGLEAQYDQNKNNYDNMWKSFKEMAQVSEMYTADLKKVYDSAIQGRYDDKEKNLLFKFVQEHNPNFSDGLYVKLQARIEAGRNAFMAEQQTLLDKKRAYKDLLGGNTALFVNMWFNFPRVDLNKYNIVTSDKTETEFKAGKADEVKLR
jgi:hypothetical protein